MREIPRWWHTRFDWKKGAGSTTLQRIGYRNFPSSFDVESLKTGVIQRFIIDEETNEHNEFFDGEAMAYISPQSGVKIRIWC